MSFAFVFRRVKKKTSKFNHVNHTWLWKLENQLTRETVKAFLKKNGSDHDIFRKVNCDLDHRSLGRNMLLYVSELCQES